MLTLTLLVIAALLVWIGINTNSIVINSAIAATEAANLRVMVAELTEKVDALQSQLDQKADATVGLPEVITLLAYWLAQRPEFFGLEPDYLTEKDLSDDERRLRSNARVALSILSSR